MNGFAFGLEIPPGAIERVAFADGTVTKVPVPGVAETSADSGAYVPGGYAIAAAAGKLYTLVEPSGVGTALRRGMCGPTRRQI